MTLNNSIVIDFLLLVLLLLLLLWERERERKKRKWQKLMRSHSILNLYSEYNQNHKYNIQEKKWNYLFLTTTHLKSIIYCCK